MQAAAFCRPVRPMGLVEPTLRSLAIRGFVPRVGHRGLRPAQAVHAPGNGKLQHPAFQRDDEDILAPLDVIYREAGVSETFEHANRVVPDVKTAGGSDEDLAREKFWGRVAVLALGAVLLAERLTGNGAVQSLDLETGIPLWEIDPFLGLLVAGLLVAAFFPCSSERTQLMRDAKVAHLRARNFGKTLFDRVQAWTGRLACFGLASSIVAEVATGKGALALLNIETGVGAISEVEAGIAFLVMLLLTEDIKRRC